MYEVVYMEEGKKKFGYVERLSDLRGKAVLKTKKVRDKKPQQQELAFLFDAIGDLINSGEGLSSALERAISSAKDVGVKMLLFKMLYQVREGKSVAEPIMDEVLRTIIKNGEEGGLGDAFKLAASVLEQRQAMKGELIKKLSYPVAMLLAGVIALLINSLYTIPRILTSPLLKDYQAQSFTIGILSVVAKIAPMGLLFFGLFLVVFFVYSKIDKKGFEEIILRLGVIRALLLYFNFYISFLALYNLLRSGASFTQALEILKRNAPLFILRAEFERVLKKVKEGGEFAESFRLLSDIERGILKLSKSERDIAQVALKTAERFRKLYLRSVGIMSTVIYTSVLIFVLGLLLLLVSAILIPYGEALRRIG